MLEIKNIKKTYITGELVQSALDDVSLSFRSNEFVSILGPSGSGKTTLLNIIGGLDRYDSGDLIINGTSTKKYKDRDWDTYRNHSIGFVFQSYNLIPHQSVLSNVELALTISGISKSARRKMAIEALEKVGLKEHIHKKPNQMSGGQMQRVAIARALVNNPDILLADEPTGALDTETGLQVMELLSSVAKDKLVVMVTHNPELAEKYSNRIVNLRDGKIVSDSNPFVEKETIPAEIKKPNKKAAMSFLTALSLSFNNLRTKKGRTILTSFAGSIGIIGIALILALSTGVNNYINDIQKETMTSYPITISAETIDMSGLISMRGTMIGEMSKEPLNREGIYADNVLLEAGKKFSSSITENNLTAFKKYLDNPDSEIAQYLGENGVLYTYDVSFGAYSYDKNGVLVNTGADTDEITGVEGASNGGMMSNMQSYISGSSDSEAKNFEQLMPGTDDAVSPVITDSYEVLYGSWPQNYDEIILILDKNNSIPSNTLYQLGLITKEEYQTICDTIADGKEPDEIKFDYADVCNHTFYLVPACDSYIENEDGTFSYIGNDTYYEKTITDNALKLKITGVVKPVEDAANASLTSNIGYTAKLTDYIITHTDESSIVKAQEENPNKNVLTGMNFTSDSDSQKAEDAKSYISSLSISEKANLYKLIMYYSSQSTSSDESAALGAGMQSGQMNMDEASVAAALDMWLTNSPDEEILLSIYDQYIKGGSYEDNMKSFGKVSLDAPFSISIYADSFEDKDSISASIENYNKTVEEGDKIVYTDYVALLTSSITSMVDVVSYVLIAFVAVSLIVSCIMIGIITHISVLERTKEIGILRALGASKGNISQVFNAETVIIGFCSGILGVGLSALLTLPINAVIQALTGLDTVKAVIPAASAAILVIISVLITMLGGLIPAKKAAKKDPVTALRTE